MQTWNWTVLKFIDTMIWGRAFSMFFWNSSRKIRWVWRKPIGFDSNLPSQVVSDATWSAFNGRLAAVSEGQAYFSSVHRCGTKSLATTLRQLCQARPELTLFAAEEFCTKALAEAGVFRERWEEKLCKNCMHICNKNWGGSILWICTSPFDSSSHSWDIHSLTTNLKVLISLGIWMIASIS